MKPSKKFKILIFDMDGVLFDTIPFAKDNFLSNYSGTTDEMYKDIHKGNFHEEIKKYSHLKKEETEEEKNSRIQEYSEGKSKMPMFKGIREFLEKLHAEGYILVLNTNAYELNCFPILEKSNITHLFNFVAAAELSKSKVEKFRLIEEKYNVSKKDILFITDALGDVREADISNIPTVAVTWGVHDRSFLKSEPHQNLIGIVDTVKELEDFIESN
jgi:HAD superfamily hydrolase (TIGR01509 family)